MPVSSMPTARTEASPTTATDASPARIQDSLLTGVERRVLVWLAHRMPARVHSDHLTLLALTAMCGAGVSYWIARVNSTGLLMAIVCLIVNWFGDSLDGTLARVRRQQRPRYGYYVDHVVDALGAVALFGGLGLSGYMQPAIAGAVLVAYFLVCIEVYLAAHSIGQFHMTYFGMGPTELRIVLALGTLVLVVHPEASVWAGALSLFDVGGIAGTAGLLFTFCYAAVGHGRLLYQQEPMPTRGVSPRSPSSTAPTTR